MSSDLVIDYELLNQAATDIKGLSPEIDRIKNNVRFEGRAAVEIVPGQNNANNYDLGPGTALYQALGAFYARWSSDCSNAMDGLNKMAGYFQGVADSFMETDASQAAGMNESAMMSAVLRYPGLVDQYYEAIGAKGADASKYKYPDAVENPFSLAGTTGLSTSFTYGGTDTAVPDADKSKHGTNMLVSSETTTVHQGSMNYSETTTFGADKGWGPNGGPTQDTTQVINNPDGTTDTIKTTVDAGSGSGTETDYNSSTKDTTTYTRADWNSKWVDTTPSDQSDS